jgi:hypothetical protein
MRKSLFCLCTFVAASLSAMASGDAPDRVELRSQRLPPAASALTAACPTLHTQLPDALARTHRMLGEAATVQVSFTLQGQRVSAVTVHDGSARYRRAVHWALQELECAGDSAAPQQYGFKVRFVAPQQASGDRSVAVLEDTYAPRMQ